MQVWNQISWSYLSPRQGSACKLENAQWSNGGEGIPCDLGSKTAVDDAETTAVVPRCSIVL